MPVVAGLTSATGHLCRTSMSKIVMFADDCTMFSTIHHSSDNEAAYTQMQQGLGNIQAWR